MTNKPQKILYIITKSVWGGAGKYVFDLASKLPKDSFYPIVAAGGQEPLADKIRKKNIEYREIKNFQRDISIIRDFFSFFEITSLLLKTRPDIIHANSSKAGGIAGAASFAYSLLHPRRKLLKIFTAHGWVLSEARPVFQKFLIKLFSKLTCIFYDKIICVSEYDKNLAIKEKITNPKKLITIHNGIAETDYNFLTKEKARKELITNYKLQITNPDTLWIGTIGEFTKNKGHVYLIEAANKLKIQNLSVDRQDYKFKIFIIGWGAQETNYKSQITNFKLKNNVFLIKNLENAANYLKAFDIFVLPSLKEGLPYTILEAGLARLPVIASRVGGIPEIIENKKNSFLIEAGNAEEIGNHIVKLSSDKNLSCSLSFSLWEKINRDFSFKKMLDSTLTAYKENG